MEYEKELHNAFETHLENQGFEIVTHDEAGRIFIPDTIAKKDGTTNLYEYKLSPNASDFYRLVYQTYTYEPEADKCYIVTRNFLHKVKEIAQRTGWGYIVYDGESKSIVVPHDYDKATDRVKPDPSECPFSEVFGLHDYRNPELAEKSKKRYENSYTTNIGEFKRHITVHRKKCPFCGKIVEKTNVRVKEVE